jgi:hypothetical protein
MDAEFKWSDSSTKWSLKPVIQKVKEVNIQVEFEIFFSKERRK